MPPIVQASREKDEENLVAQRSDRPGLEIKPPTAAASTNDRPLSEPTVQLLQTRLRFD